MAKISKDLGNGATLHPRENLFANATLGSLNAETIVDCHGASTVYVDLRGTFSLTIEIAGTVDGTNWQLIPVKPINQAAIIYVAAIAGTAAGTWAGECGGYTQVRARVTAYTSGAATTNLTASNASLPLAHSLNITANTATIPGTAGAATTLTITAAGAGLRHYLTYLAINRFATALLTAGTAPITVTTTNIPGSLAFSFPAEAAAQGTLDRWREDFAFPIATSALNTNTTIVCPATTNVIWRITAGFYVAP